MSDNVNPSATVAAIQRDGTHVHAFADYNKQKVLLMAKRWCEQDAKA